MRLSNIIAPLMLVLLLTGCGQGKVNDSAICSGLDPLVNSHADALIVDGGPKSLVTGERLITGFDAGCHK